MPIPELPERNLPLPQLITYTEAQRIDRDLALLLPGGDVKITGTETQVIMDEEGRRSFFAVDSRVQYQDGAEWKSPEPHTELKTGMVLRVSPAGGEPVEVTISESLIAFHLSISSPLPPSDRNSKKAPLGQSAGQPDETPESELTLADIAADLDFAHALAGYNPVEPAEDSGPDEAVDERAALPSDLVLPPPPRELDFSALAVGEIVMLGLFGRGQFQFDDPFVSRRHLEVRKTSDGKFELRDHSSYGTQVLRGEHAWALSLKEWTKVEAGSVIQLGGDFGPQAVLGSRAQGS